MRRAGLLRLLLGGRAGRREPRLRRPALCVGEDPSSSGQPLRSFKRIDWGKLRQDALGVGLGLPLLLLRLLSDWLRGTNSGSIGHLESLENFD